MTEPRAPIVPFDAENLVERLRHAAERLGVGGVDAREIEHLVAVVTRCSALIEDVYTDDRLRSILGDDPRRLAALLAMPWFRPAVADDLPGMIMRLRRIPDRVREVGDQALFDLAISGRQRIHGVDLGALGPRAYGLAAEVLELLAADARLREHFVENTLGRPMRIEEEVSFLRGCAERFDLYSRLLRAAGGEERGDAASSIYVPAVRPRQDLVAAAEIPASASAPSRAEEQAIGGGRVFGEAVSARAELLAAYERLLLFASLDLDALRSDLESTVIDQQDAIATLVDDVSLYAVGTQHLTRPGSYFLVGPTGVGKNYLVETLASVLGRQWGIEVPLLTIEGPNYTYSSDINELRGATRGFIRSDEPGLLTAFHERASRAPLSVILVDEVEKAHPQLRRFFLSIMDRGSTTDAHGNELGFAGTLLFFTSNIGYKEGRAPGRPIGFGGESEAAAAYRAELSTSLKRTLSPEFLGRVKILRFTHLPRSSATRILELEFEKIARRYRELHGIEITLSPEGLEALLDEGYSEEYGARHLAAVLQRICNVGIGKMIRGDESRSSRETSDLLARVRELRESDADVDLTRLDREILEQARAKVPYKRIVVDAEGEGLDRRIVYRKES